MRQLADISGGVSIHAPREGCDLCSDRIHRLGDGFNSRTPGGVRPALSLCAGLSEVGFNSRTPGGVRLYRSILSTSIRCFNSRTPGGVRRIRERQGHCEKSFNSRTPGGVRLSLCTFILHICPVSIHAPREGCDIVVNFLVRKQAVSIHAPREGCDRYKRAIKI